MQYVAQGQFWVLLFTHISYKFYVCCMDAMFTCVYHFLYCIYMQSCNNNKRFFFSGYCGKDFHSMLQGHPHLQGNSLPLIACFLHMRIPSLGKHPIGFWRTLESYRGFAWGMEPGKLLKLAIKKITFTGFWRHRGQTYVLAPRVQKCHPKTKPTQKNQQKPSWWSPQRHWISPVVCSWQ